MSSGFHNKNDSINVTKTDYFNQIPIKYFTEGVVNGTLPEANTHMRNGELTKETRFQANSERNSNLMNQNVKDYLEYISD